MNKNIKKTKWIDEETIHKIKTKRGRKNKKELEILQKYELQLNELGIVGFIFYMALVVYTLRAFKAALSYKSHGLVPKDLLVINIAGLLYHILFGFKTSTYAGSFMLYFFMGASLSLTQFSRQQERLEFEQAYYEPADLQQDYFEQ